MRADRGLQRACGAELAKISTGHQNDLLMAGRMRKWSIEHIGKMIRESGTALTKLALHDELRPNGVKVVALGRAYSDRIAVKQSQASSRLVFLRLTRWGASHAAIFDARCVAAPVIIPTWRKISQSLNARAVP